MRYFGTQTKPVQASLNALEKIGAIEYVEGSSKAGLSFYPFTVKLKSGFEYLTDDGCLFCCRPRKLHRIAARITQSV